MSGNTQELAAESKKPTATDLEALKQEIQKFYPDYKLKLEETYTNTVLEGHRVHIRHYLENQQTGHTIEVAKTTTKIPKCVPKWITKHNLWDHTQGELKMLRDLIQTNKEKYPSKKTLSQWQEMVKRDRKKAHVYQTLNNQKPKTDTKE